MKLEELIENIAENYEDKFIVTYCLKEEAVMQIEGRLNKNKELVFVIKILKSELLGKGLGTQGFDKMMNHFGEENIDVICGSWHQDEEFSYFEAGMSTNLKIFKEKVEEMSPEEAALCTPTGKWAVKYGYTKVEMLSNRVDEVCVKFYKL